MSQSGRRLSESRELAAELLFFTLGNQQWFTGIGAALAGLDDRNASRVPAPGLNSVWATTNHVAFWTDLVRRRLGREAVSDHEAIESGWSLPAAGTESDWQQTLAMLEHRTRDVARLISSLPDRQLDEEWATGRATRRQSIYGLIAHGSYHAADVVTARVLLGVPVHPAVAAS